MVALRAASDRSSSRASTRSAKPSTTTSSSSGAGSPRRDSSSSCTRRTGSPHVRAETSGARRRARANPLAEDLAAPSPGGPARAARTRDETPSGAGTASALALFSGLAWKAPPRSSYSSRLCGRAAARAPALAPRLRAGRMVTYSGLRRGVHDNLLGAALMQRREVPEAAHSTGFWRTPAAVSR